MKGRWFVPEAQPRVVRDATLGGAPALLLGWWMGKADEEPVAEVISMASHRRVRDLATWHGDPVQPPREAIVGNKVVP